MVCMRLLEATTDFLGEYEALSRVPLGMEGFVQWFVLEESARPIGRFLPGVVPLLPLPGHEGMHHFWSAMRSAPAPRLPPAPQGPAPLADQQPPPPAADDLPDDGASENEGDLGEEDADSDGGGDVDNLAALAEEFAEAGFEAPAAPARERADVAAPAEAPQPAPVEAAQPAPAPDAPPAPVAERRARTAAEVTYYVPGGSIAFYPSKACFQAVCECGAHGRCVLTRTHRSRQSAASDMPIGGRPVGFLAAWLARGEGCSDKTEHWSPDAMINSQEFRAQQRALIANTPGGRLLLSFERPAAPGEPDEPETLRGYVEDPWL